MVLREVKGKELNSSTWFSLETWKWDCDVILVGGVIMLLGMREREREMRFLVADWLRETGGRGGGG